MQLLLHPFLRQPFRHLLRQPTWPDFEAILLPAFEFYSRLRDQKLQNEIAREINQKLLKVDNIYNSGEPWIPFILNALKAKAARIQA